jgi:hypothetical protein
VPREPALRAEAAARVVEPAAAGPGREALNRSATIAAIGSASDMARALASQAAAAMLQKGVAAAFLLVIKATISCAGMTRAFLLY